MATYYQSEDGSNWKNETDAHAANYAYTGWNLYIQGNFDGAIEMYNKGFALNPGSPKFRLFTYRGHAYLGKNDYDRAMEDFRFSIAFYDQCDKSDPGSYSNLNQLRSIYSSFWAFERSCIASSLFGRGSIHSKRGNRDQAIADWKLAADLGSTTALTALANNGIQYTPQQRYSSSSSSSSSRSSYSDDKRGVFLSIVFGLVGGIGFVCTLAWIFKLFPGIYFPPWITLIPFAVLTFITWRIRSKFFFPLIILALFGWLYNFHIIPKPNSKPTTTQTQMQTQTLTATTSQNVNFRDKPSTDSNIIVQIPQGETVTVTGTAENGWTPIEYKGNKGWVSSEYIKQ